MNEYTHSCIKCHSQYKDTDVDDFYCPVCNDEKKKIAAEVDKKLVTKIRKTPKSDLQLYDEARRSSGMSFPPISSLGIKL